MDAKTISQFVESWGSMGALWGINRSMARVHALLIVTDHPLSLDDVAQGLGISRGNASMCLKELRGWGVVQRVHEAGDRKDYYVTETDVWSMFFRIMAERKKREFDPALAALRQTLELVDGHTDEAVRKRLAQMEDLLSTMNRLASKVLAHESSSRAMLRFLTSSLLEG